MASGFVQLLKAFGIEFDPEEIKAEALKFREIMLDIDRRLTQLQAQNAALAQHLGLENFPHDRLGTARPDEPRPAGPNGSTAVIQPAPSGD